MYFVKSTSSPLSEDVKTRDLVGATNSKKGAHTSIKCQWINGDFSFDPKKKVIISIVAYEHQLGIPARLYIGLIPAIVLAKELRSMSVEATIRIIDPATIANHCNGWEIEKSMFWKIKKTLFRQLISTFIGKHDVDFFFDEAEPVSEEMLKVLGEVGSELLSTQDLEIVDMVQRIMESGRKHGGEIGASNAILYMAAHPFSWLDMYHPLIWKKQYFSEDHQFVNLVSKPETRFTVIRNFLRDQRPDLVTSLCPVEYEMAVCNTPCYIPLEDEPTISDLGIYGYDWCHKLYKDVRNKSSNHKRALKDFESILPFLDKQNI